LSRRTLSRLVLLCALAVAPAAVYAAENPPELEESTTTELEKLKPLLDAKNWNGSIALIAALQAKVKPESYDMAFLADILGKLYLQIGDYGKAVAPLETAVRLGDAHHYFDKNQQQDSVYYLAQLFYQEATSTKDRALQKQHVGKALDYLKRWIGNSNKPPFDPARAEATMLYANVLYFDATLDPAHINMDLLKQSEIEIQNALRSTVRPKENLYIVLLAIYQQQGNYAGLADVLEQLVKQFPNKKDYWAQLAGVYGSLVGTEKDEQKQREYNIRTIVAIERAQALGFMKTPRENYSLFGVYYNVGQFGRATEILHAGLRDGSIESDLKNWELLASSYQQVDRPFDAIAALKEGAKKFPQSGQLDYQAAMIYYSLNKPADAFSMIESAMRKGHFDKPGSVYGFAAYVAWELNKLPEALEAVNKALTYPESKKDAQLPKLKTFIEEALQNRAAATEGNKA
jgi:predicted Zn-dependent protease